MSNQCRFCEDRSQNMVKYGVRHYAHFKCYLVAGKKLSDLQAWKVGQFPWKVIKDHGLEQEAWAICSELARNA